MREAAATSSGGDRSGGARRRAVEAEQGRSWRRTGEGEGGTAVAMAGPAAIDGGTAAPQAAGRSKAGWLAAGQRRTAADRAAPAAGEPLLARKGRGGKRAVGSGKEAGWMAAARGWDGRPDGGWGGRRAAAGRMACGGWVTGRRGGERAWRRGKERERHTHSTIPLKGDPKATNPSCESSQDLRDLINLISN